VSFFERLKESTIGFSGYRRLIRDRTGGFGYVSLLLLIVLAISCLINTVKFKNELAVVADQVAAAPDFGLQNGEVYFNGKMPYKITFPGDSTIIVVDTTGQTKPDDLKGYTQGILITKDKLYQVQLGRTQETDLTRLPITVTKADLVSAMRGMWWIVPVGFMFLYPFQLGFKALDAVVLAVIASLWGSVQRREVPFALGYKVGLYAMSLPIIMQWVVPNYSVNPLNWPVGAAGFFAWWAVAIIYLIYGLQSYFRPQDEEPDAFDQM
jgi:hypothetical protein